MIVDIVDKYRTDDNNPIKNLRLEVENLKIVELNKPEKHENVSLQLKDYLDIGIIIKNIEAKHSKLLKGI